MSEKLRLPELVRRPEARLAAASLVILAAVWGIAELAEYASRAEPGAFDEAMLYAFRKGPEHAEIFGPGWVEKVALDLTVLGGHSFVTLLVLIVLGYLLLSRRFFRALEVFLATVGGAVAALGLKEVFDRPRPDVVPPLYEVTNASFPSGHAAIAAVIYLTLAILLARFIAERVLTLYVMGAAAVLVFIVGWTRVILGVHYATDVLAGWTLGLSWSLFCWLLVDFLEARRARTSPGSRRNKADETQRSPEPDRSHPSSTTPKTGEQPS